MKICTLKIAVYFGVQFIQNFLRFFLHGSCFMPKKNGFSRFGHNKFHFTKKSIEIIPRIIPFELPNVEVELCAVADLCLYFYLTYVILLPNANVSKQCHWVC